MMEKKEKNYIRRFRSLDCWNLDEVSEYLHEMALKGLMLKKITGGCCFTFAKCEPKDLRFEVVIFPKGSEFDTHTIETNFEYIDYCQKAGWEFVCSTGKIDIFCTEDVNAPEIDSDSEIKLRMIKKESAPTYVASPMCFIFLGLVFLFNYAFININVLEMNASFFATLVLIEFNALIQVFIIIRYFIWSHRANVAVKNGEKIPDINSSGWKAFCIVAYSILLIGSLIMGFVLDKVLICLLLIGVIIVIIIIAFKYILFAFAEKRKFGRVLNASFFIVANTCIILALVALAASNIFFKMDARPKNYALCEEDLSYFEPDETFAYKKCTKNSYGNFLLCENHYILSVRNGESISDGYEKYGDFKGYTWNISVYSTKYSAIYDRLIRDAKNYPSRPFGVRYDFYRASRDERLEHDGITVWVYVDKGEYYYLLCNGEFIVSVYCDLELSVEQIDVIVRSFLS